MIGAYVAGGVTGAHMNPAVTLGMALRGKTRWIMVRFRGFFLEPIKISSFLRLNYALNMCICRMAILMDNYNILLGDMRRFEF